MSAEGEHIPAEGGAPDAPAWTIGRRILVPAPPERTWQALTDPEELRLWLAQRVELDLRPGGRFAFFGRCVFGQDDLADEDVAARPGNFEVLDVRAPDLLVFRWHVLGVPTTVRVELERHLEQTDLRVEQSSGRPPPWPSARGEPHWWHIALPALAAVVEGGRADLRVDWTRLEGSDTLTFRVPVTTFPWIIWGKLTREEELRRWWGRSPELQLEPGGAFRLEAGGPGPRQVLEVEPERRLVHDWHWEDGTVGRVAWEIEETEAETLVTLTDHGPRPPAEPAARAGCLRAATLLWLKRQSERGISPREEDWPPPA